MGRAELRRQKKKDEKVKVATYNFTEAQLEAYMSQALQEKLDKIKQQATDDAVNTAMVLLLTLPLEVLIDFYWPKSYEKRIPEFTQHVLDYYTMWQNGDIKMEDLQNDLWEFAGIRLEEGEA